MFHSTGGGLFIFADNAPFITHANVILERICNTELMGSTPGQDNKLTLGAIEAPGRFKSHLLTTGITGELYEGHTICYPKKKEGKAELETLAISAYAHPAILYKEAQGNKGRIVVDTGFTKLWLQWDSAGTERYICNSAVWLLGIDYRIENNLPLRVFPLAILFLTLGSPVSSWKAIKRNTCQ